MYERFIESDSSGKAMIAGTHITVADVLRQFAVCGTVDSLLTVYPELTRASVQAALEFAAEKIRLLTLVPSSRPEEQTILLPEKIG